MKTKALCKICGIDLPLAPLLHYVNMPKSAQMFPDQSAVASDQGVDLEIIQCVGCGLVQLNREPVPYYREVIRAAAFSGEMRGFREKQFAEFVEIHGLSGKKFLEVGCGRGEYLSLIQKAGAAAFGIEYAPDSVRFCQKSGLNVFRGFIERPDYSIASGPFDAFAILNFLEHIPELGVALRGIAHNLVPGGIGLVEVPNFDMIVRKNLFSEFIPDHLYYFTRDTLANALALNGFEVMECREIWHDYIISATVRKRSALDLSRFLAVEAGLKAQFQSFLARFGNKNVAVWGAGHQALAVLALAGIAGQIKYVVDSAPFKQGKFTPASHLPIVPPEQLRSDPVEAIIVMAASYSDEVVKIIREEFGTGIQVAVLRDERLEECVSSS